MDVYLLWAEWLGEPELIGAYTTEDVAAEVVALITGTMPINGARHPYVAEQFWVQPVAVSSTPARRYPIPDTPIEPPVPARRVVAVGRRLNSTQTAEASEEGETPSAVTPSGVPRSTRETSGG